jgi:kumamolisin
VSDASVAFGPHDANAVLSLNVGLDVRNSSGLDAVIRAASTPGSRDFGHYLTRAQYRALYGPTDAQVAAVREWLESNGVRVMGVSPDNLIVDARATTAVAERAFGVTINDYGVGKRRIFANSTVPTVPAELSVRWVTGLDNYSVAQTFHSETRGALNGAPPYFPSDFQQAYDVSGVPLNPPGSSRDETIGFTLWGAPLQQSDLDTFASDTSSPRIVVGQTGPDGIDFVPCTASSCQAGGTQSGDTSAWVETALDVEEAHGVAPGAHLRYWLAATDGSGHADAVALENAVNAAANDTSVHVVSNSWGFDGSDFKDPNLDASLQEAASAGTTFFFASGDTQQISYPATSPYVVAVGGTTLNLDTHSNYASETVWNSGNGPGGGTGCSLIWSRPSWQVGVGAAATCPGRAEPDVAADADPGTGAYVVVSGASQTVGGTSLAAPLWAGMATVWNELDLEHHQPGIGFVAPLLYSIGNNATSYAYDFHDVTMGETGSHPAGPGWDEATGWGSPDLAHLTVGKSPIPTTTTLHSSTNPVVVPHSATFSIVVAPTPDGGTVAFTEDGRAISGCATVPVLSGRASCTVAYLNTGTFGIDARFTGHGNYQPSSSTILSEHAENAPAGGYRMVDATGIVYHFGAAGWYGNARTAGVTHFEPTPTGKGYWIVNAYGQVYAFGDAPALGNAAGLLTGETVSSLSSTPSGRGYWLFTDRGRVLHFGDAQFFGDMSQRTLNGPVIGSIGTPSGHGYYMVASDGGIFSFGDARFRGSMGGTHLNKPVIGLVPTADNGGYWLVASDGGIFAFGDAAFHGSMGGAYLNKPVVGMVRYGNGYLMVGSDGGIFDFSNDPFLGSLGGITLPSPIVSVGA